ncbi:MAG: HAD-IIB family hydrolase [Gammaproteobacteria bacterium]|nr:HAD-IIB family hydrolase [Gammaproteobacteria bacterium]
MTARLLLCSDLDRTLLPNGPQPESPDARARFARFVSRPGVVLVYVTGRHRELVEQAIANYRLPRPDFVIGDVGTTIFEVTQNGWHLQQAWQAEIAPDWAGLEHADISALLAGNRLLRLQETAKQNIHKLSYYVPLDVDQVALLDDVRQCLVKHHVNASLVWSVDEPAGIGLLDVLPARANKLHAVEFLMQHCRFSYMNTVFAGDSGNDLAVLSSAIPAVLVANASAEVRAAAQQQAAALGNSSRLYLAVGGLLGMNGNYSAGVLEGVVHFMPPTRLWLDRQGTGQAE